MTGNSPLLRIWIVISLLWGVMVSLYVWRNFPDVSDAQRERIAGMYRLLIQREKTINPEFDKRYGHITAENLAEDIVRRGKADAYAASFLEKWDGKVDFSAVEKRFERRKRQIPILRLRYIGIAVAAWSLPVVLSFFLGWVIIRARGTAKGGSASDSGFDV
jgi:hypothetical protein